MRSRLDQQRLRLEAQKTFRITGAFSKSRLAVFVPKSCHRGLAFCRGRPDPALWRSRPMRRPVDHAAFRAVGYFADLSVEAGRDAPFHLSTRRSRCARARVVRIDRATAPESTAWPVAATGAGLKVQDAGSRVVAPPSGRMSACWIAGLWTLGLEFRLTGSTSRPHADRKRRHRGKLPQRGRARFFMAPPPQPGKFCRIGCWLHAQLCSADGGLSLVVTRERGSSAPVSPFPPRAGCRPRFGYGVDLAGLLSDDESRDRSHSSPGPGGSSRRRLAFSGGRASAAAAGDRGSAAILEVHNAPSFGLRSPRWDGSALDPRLQPEHYDAIALHDDDLAEAGLAGDASHHRAGGCRIRRLCARDCDGQRKRHAGRSS